MYTVHCALCRAKDVSKWLAYQVKIGQLDVVKSRQGTPTTWRKMREEKHPVEGEEDELLQWEEEKEVGDHEEELVGVKPPLKSSKEVGASQEAANTNRFLAHYELGGGGEVQEEEEEGSLSRLFGGNRHLATQALWWGVKNLANWGASVLFRAGVSIFRQNCKTTGMPW